MNVIFWTRLAGKIVRSRERLQINLRRKVTEDFIKKGGDFVAGNVSGCFEWNLNILAGKEFHDVG